ncbi:IS3 family transposase [Ancylomarina sp. 16SWW S1-10-2]|uniref:IS3 family transposase n=1 Tax=Ancylomarina sp. 16SWW S1-10-2 TaxID=2499681 RepID=UPI0018A01E6B
MWLKSEPSQRVLENKRFTQQIRLIYDQSKQTYASLRITEELKARVITVSRPRVVRLEKGKYKTFKTSVLSIFEYIATW